MVRIESQSEKMKENSKWWEEDEQRYGGLRYE